MKKILSALLSIFVFSMPVFSATVYQAGGKFGLKDDSGKVILNPQYQSVVQLTYTPSKKVIIPMHAMDEVEVKKLDFYKVKQNNLWGVVNSHGKITHECKYKDVQTDSNGDITFTLPNGTTEYAHPVLNGAKAARDTLVTIVGLPVTLIGACMIPIEAISKAGRGGVNSK